MQELGRQPTQPGLLDDLDKGRYFDRASTLSRGRPTLRRAGSPHQAVSASRGGEGAADALSVRLTTIHRRARELADAGNASL